MSNFMLSSCLAFSDSHPISKKVAIDTIILHEETEVSGDEETYPGPQDL